MDIVKIIYQDQQTKGGFYLHDICDLPRQYRYQRAGLQRIPSVIQQQFPFPTVDHPESRHGMDQRCGGCRNHFNIKAADLFFILPGAV